MGYRVAVVGATGNVGREMLAILAEREFPCDEVAAVASSRSTGTEVEFGDTGKMLKCRNIEHFDFAVLISLQRDQTFDRFCAEPEMRFDQLRKLIRKHHDWRDRFTERGTSRIDRLQVERIRSCDENCLAFRTKREDRVAMNNLGWKAFEATEVKIDRRRIDDLQAERRGDRTQCFFG